MSFEQEIEAFVVKTKNANDRTVRYLCLDLFSEVVKGTPVDTGRARANWQASVNQPIETPVDKEDKSGGQTINNAGNAVKEATGKIFYITNNLPYISRLEFEGWSSQARSGWVRTAIERTKRIARLL